MYLVSTTALRITVKIKKGKYGRFMGETRKQEHGGTEGENIGETQEENRRVDSSANTFP